MNAISALLQRATRELAAAETPAAPDAFACGRPVVLSTVGVDELAGQVAFEDDGWIYWVAVDGSVHATKRDALKGQ